MTIIVIVDEENPAVEWWSAAQADPDPPTCIAEWIRQTVLAPLYLTEAQAQEVARWASTLPGWGGGPKYAPHPLVFTQAD